MSRKCLSELEGVRALGTPFILLYRSQPFSFSVDGA